MQRLRTLVLSGGPSSEHEVSLWSAEMVLKNLDRKKYEVHFVVMGKDGKWKFNTGRTFDVGDAITYIKHSRFDFAFIAMHGFFGEDGRMQALLEWMEISHSGSGVKSSAMAMDKHVSNLLYATHGLRVPNYIVLDTGANKKRSTFPLPFVVKPICGGSTVGVSIVKKSEDLKSALAKAFEEDGRVMIQEHIQGREFTCGVLENKNGRSFALPPTEIIPKTSNLFDYRAKYTNGGSAEITPPRLPKPQINELQKLALRAHEILGCRGMSRSDFILRKSKFYILETNTIPGMTATSLLPQAARVAGISFTEMLDLIIAAGMR